MLQIVPAEEWFAKVASIPAKRKGVSIGPQASKKFKTSSRWTCSCKMEKWGVRHRSAGNLLWQPGSCQTYVPPGLHSAKRGGDPLLLGGGGASGHPEVVRLFPPRSQTSDGHRAHLWLKFRGDTFQWSVRWSLFWWASLLRFLHCSGDGFSTQSWHRSFWSHRHQCHGWPKSDIESHRFWHGRDC